MGQFITGLIVAGGMILLMLIEPVPVANGIAVAIVLLGVYLSLRGWRIHKHQQKIKNHDFYLTPQLDLFEQTTFGRLLLGIIQIAFAVGSGPGYLKAGCYLTAVICLYKPCRQGLKNMLNKH